ncbi:hypothetical protein FSP39_002878 [Pinctada imbricata]|uniref:NACHT domain-containing protein n=1 Tax=Pinctada imbricata TaxID=66713 RepID=A0AA89BVB4_PINIB|nr:hypothetical protein FSP39_002878 [Pinctada imbricata]
MTHLDEARYGRACLLVLNVCPFTLRHVIDDYYAKQGSPDIQDFLNKNKHNLYHIMTKKCCCRLIQSCVTPMYRSQWDLLYTKNRLPCRGTCLTGGECPCKFDPIPGITSNEMDITLCCLVIKNICQGPGINMTHIDTIRNIRYKLIHASSATLDEPTYNGYWSDVKNAVLFLANSVSSTVHTDTAKMIQDLETRVMNKYELEELKKVIINQKMLEERVSETEKNLEKTNESVVRVEENVNQLEEYVNQVDGNLNQLEGNVAQIQESVSQLEGNVDLLDRNMGQVQGDMSRFEGNLNQVEENVNQLEGNVSRLEGKVNQFEENVNRRVIGLEGNISRTSTEVTRLGDTFNLTSESSKRKISKLEDEIGEQGKTIKCIKQQLYSTSDNSLDQDPNVGTLKQRLIKINDDISKVIPLSPLQKRRNDLPIELLFAKFVIHEDQNYAEKGDNSDRMSGLDSSSQLPGSSDSLDTQVDSRFVADSKVSSSEGHPTRSFPEVCPKEKRELSNPDDIFKLNNDISNSIYMLGDAAHGKTTFCKWLVKKWCNAQNEDGQGRELDVWEKALKGFDFVFLLQFRYVNPNRASVIDMVCKDVSRSLNAIRHVLSSEKYKSLVIMDGLDEWNPNNEARRGLKCQGMPNLDELSNTVTCFISMRPWVFPAISELVQIHDRVIEILGLSETGMKQVIKNVLLNRYKLNENSSEYKEVHDKIEMNLNQKNLKSFMQIPLLAVVCVQIWYEGKQVGYGMASFYAAMLNMLIERANKNHTVQIEDNKTVQCKVPDILSEHVDIENCLYILSKLGKVAYEGLLSNEKKLVFQKRKLEKEIGVTELQFALDVGLISQNEAPSLVAKEVSVHFFHKSIQEFLAVIYIVTNKEVSDSFCKNLSNVKVIMELSDVIMFICGMCPSLGSIISQRVVSVTDDDTEICKYRYSRLELNATKVCDELYRIQLSWYRELQYRRTTKPVTFHVSDVYLDEMSGNNEVRMTKQLLSDQLVDIRSLFLLMPNKREYFITYKELNDYMSNSHSTRSLVMFFINGYMSDWSLLTISAPKLKNLNVFSLKTNINFHDVNLAPPLLKNLVSLRLILLANVILGDRELGLSNMTSLRELWLDKVNFGERGLSLSVDMLNLEEVRLFCICMCEAHWQKFILSLKKIQHGFDIRLHHTDIDTETRKEIYSSSDFSNVRDLKHIFDPTEVLFTFKRAWPLPHATSDNDQNESL